MKSRTDFIDKEGKIENSFGEISELFFSSFFMKMNGKPEKNKNIILYFLNTKTGIFHTFFFRSPKFV